MKTPVFRSVFWAFIGFLIPPMAVGHASPAPSDSVHFRLPLDFERWERDTYAAGKRLAYLNVGEPRTVRLIYFLPNDRPYRAEVAQKMKDEIRQVQTFYAEQMQAHGYGDMTFRVETDAEGEPLVHRVDGEHPDSYYSDEAFGAVYIEIMEAFDLETNICLTFIDNSRSSTPRGVSWGKNGGGASINDHSDWETAAHELGHAFGLEHDFRDNAYLMGHTDGSELSACATEFLAVHPHFNPEISVERGQPPTVELISAPEYPAGATSFSVKLQLGDPDGLQQVVLLTTRFDEVKACRGLEGKKEAVVELDFDDDTPSHQIPPPVRPVHVKVVDTDGNVRYASYDLVEISPYQIATLPGHGYGVHSVSFSPDGATLASGAGDGKVKLWNAETATNIATFEGHTDLIRHVSFSPDGATLASGAVDSTIKLWNVATGQAIATLLGHQNAVSSVSFSPDGAMLASSSDDKTIKLWDVLTKENIAALDHTYRVLAVSFSPDGTMLASGAGDGTIKLWNVATGQAITTLEGHRSSCRSVSFSPDGAMLASGSNDGTVKLWNVATGQAIATLLGHQNAVSSVSFSPDGAMLASSSDDKTIKLWDVLTKENIAAFGHASEVRSVSFSPDGKTLAAALFDGTVKLSPDGKALTAALFFDGTVKLWDVSEWTHLLDGELAFGFAAEVKDQAYTAGTAISALVLPEAIVGEGAITYRVSGLPMGLTFDAGTRTISGTPEAPTDGAVEVTYTAEDSTGATATLVFSITVNSPLSFGDLFGQLRR